MSEPKSAKQHLASGEPLPKGVSPEDLPAGMPQNPLDPYGHADYIPRDFYRLTPLDRPGRRALWMRTPLTDENANRKFWERPEVPEGKFVVELRAGREGDDGHVLLREGALITRKLLIDLVDALEHGCLNGVAQELYALRRKDKPQCPSTARDPLLGALAEASGTTAFDATVRCEGVEGHPGRHTDGCFTWEGDLTP